MNYSAPEYSIVETPTANNFSFTSPGVKIMGYLPHKYLENPSGNIYINMDVNELSFHINLYDIMRTKIEGYDYILNSKIKEECEVTNKELYLKLNESSAIADNLKIGIDRFINSYIKYERLLNLMLYSRKSWYSFFNILIISRLIQSILF